MPREDAILESALGRAADRLLGARYVVGLSGAGLSVESGIPPFRGPGGLWSRYGEPPMDGYQRFLRDPRRGWEERLNPRGPMRELWATLRAARPNPGHEALAALERLGVLRALITQNVDNLHRLAGHQAVVEIHGNYMLTRCIECVARFSYEEVSLSNLPPRCPRCGGILKGDTVAFGEPIPGDALDRCLAETAAADCMIVVGTSATVYPAAQFPLTVKDNGGELIEVNPEETPISRLCAVSLRGPAGQVLSELVDRVRERLGPRI